MNEKELEKPLSVIFTLLPFIGVIGFAAVAHPYFGWVGTVLIGFVGFAVGFVIWQVALGARLKKVERYIAEMPLKQLRSHLRERKNLFSPSIVLRELQWRGEDINKELPFVLDMLVADALHIRSRGLSTLKRFFPEIAKKLRGYRFNDPVEKCRKKVQKICGSYD